MLTKICIELEIPVSIVFHGRGTAIKSMLDLLGIESHERRVFMAIADGEKSKRYIEEQKKKLHLGVPGHGITVAVPVKSVGGGQAVSYLSGSGTGAKYTRPEKFDYELVMAIANAGTTDIVMNAARAAGARGGDGDTRKRNRLGRRAKVSSHFDSGRKRSCFDRRRSRNQIGRHVFDS